MTAAGVQVDPRTSTSSARNGIAAANRNDAEDRSILRRWPEVEVELARLRALPGVAEADAACVAWFKARRQAILTPETIRRWTKGARA